MVGKVAVLAFVFALAWLCCARLRAAERAAAPRSEPAALILDARDTLTPADVSDILGETAVDLAACGAGCDDVSGSGRFDALAAVYKAFVGETPGLDAAAGP